MAAHILLVESPDQPGLMHGITGVLFRHGANIVSNLEFVDRTEGRFFMRTEFEGAVNRLRMEEDLRAVLPENAVCRIPPPERRRIVLMASREHHCLADLLVRHAHGELYADVVAVVSNHTNLESLVRRFDLPFHHLPHEGQTRSAHEAAVARCLDPLQPDLLVLAKYMRVLSPEFVGRWQQRILNIHHSFLPAFVGARPYHQAHQRGVKVIGATAHYVTNELDEGPIISQQVIPVDHTFSPEDLARAGRESEQIALARALKLVLEDRVFLNGHRTVVFN